MSWIAGEGARFIVEGGAGESSRAGGLGGNLGAEGKGLGVEPEVVRERKGATW